VLLSSLGLADQKCVFGYAVDDSDLSRRLAVELIIDGLQIAVKLADEFSRELSERQIGDGCYGFSFVLSEDLVLSAVCIEARLANGGAVLGAPVILDEQGPTQSRQEAVGEVRWEGGLRLSGWVAGATTEAPIVQICIDGEIVVEEQARSWRHVAAPAFAAMRAFDITLPRRYADGRVWRASVVLPDGRELSGSPVTFVAFDSGLASLIAGLSDNPGQRLQGALFDRLVPQSIPFALFSSWKTIHPSPSPPSTEVQMLAAVFDGREIERTEASLQIQAYPHWSAGVIPAADNGFSFDATALDEFAREHATDARCCVFLLPGVELEPDALARIASCFDEWPDLALLYWDFSMTASDGETWPVALPALDYLRLLEQGYFAAGFALNTAIVRAAVSERVANVFRLANIGFDSDPGRLHVRHLPEFLSRAPASVFAGSQAFLEKATMDHLRARRLDVAVSTGDGSTWPACRVTLRANERRTVSIIIPTRDRVNLLKDCISSIRGAARRAQAEIIVIDNDSSDPRTLAFLKQLSRDGVRVLPAPGPFNFSRLNNLAAQKARGDYLCFLKNDISATEDSWLEEMLSRHLDAFVGAVGALLVRPSAMVQHAGVVLGVNFETRHAFCDRLVLDPGYTDLLRVAHECSAVTAACMTTPRELFLAAGGFDEILFPINFNDVDYCLRLREQGLRVVFTPHARLIHRESALRGRGVRLESHPRFTREQRNLRTKWGAALMADPYYSPVLSLDDPPYAALAWPLRDRGARLAAPVPARVVPAGM
jgi:O-antigen biosynthesis protein